MIALDDDQRYGIALDAARTFVRGRGHALDECDDVVFVVLTDQKDGAGKTLTRYVIKELVDVFVGWTGLAVADIVPMFDGQWGQIELAAVYDAPGDRLRRVWRRGSGDVLDDGRWCPRRGSSSA